MRILLFVLSLCISPAAFAQLDSVYAEIFYEDDGTLLGYPCGFTTYRIYAALSDSNMEVVSVHSDDLEGADLLIGSEGGMIWNTGWGGMIASTINPDFYELDSAAVYDSFVTIDRTHSEDEGDQLLLNMNPFETDQLRESFGIPEGTLPDSTGALEHVGSDLVFQYTAGWQSVDGLVDSFNDGPVLLAQVTTNGTLNWRINVTVRVTVSPGMGDLFFTYHHNHNDPEATGTYGETRGLTGTIGNDIACGYYPQCYLDADFNQSGMVDVPDVLALLADFGCNGSCPTDLDGDGQVQTSDLLDLLAVLWESCD